MFAELLAEAFGLVKSTGEPVPLAGVDVKADIVGRAAGITLAQRFVNTEESPIEAVYKFPLPETGAVCGFRVRLGDRVIESDIEEREEAFRRYDEALAEGHGAYLLDQERPNIYTLSVGNLEPGMEAITEVSYVGPLDPAGAGVRFFLPTTISPRYVPVGMTDEERRRAGGAVNPDFARDVPYGLHLSLSIQDRDSIESVASPSHHVVVDFGGSTVRVEFTAETAKMDRDFVLNITYKEGFEHRGYLCRTKDEAFAQIDLSLPEPEQAPAAREHEVVFVIDCSGSMSGSSIDQARQALAILLRSLTEGVRFNVIRFGSKIEPFFTAPKPYTVASAQEALARVEAMKADLGGTEMMAPLELAMQKPPAAAARRAVVLITDGQISNEEQVVRLVEGKRERNRVFTVGIGRGPNEYFVRQLARTSGGLCVMVAPGERIEPPILRLFGRVMSVPVTDLEIEWPGPAEQAPFDPAVHLGESTGVFARIPEAPPVGEEVLAAAVSARAADATIGLRIPLEEVPADSSPLPRLWARERMRDLEEGSDLRSRRGSKQERAARDVSAQIVELSKRYGVISRRTSFLAIETRTKKATRRETVLRKVPVILTSDWHGLGGLQAASPAWFAATPGYVGSAGYGRAVDMSAGPEDFAGAESPQRRSLRGRGKSRGKARGLPAGSTAERFPTPGPRPGEREDDSPEARVLSLLALQRPQGGFPLSAELAKLAGLPLKALRKAAAEVAAAGRPEAEAMVATAAVLAVLRTRFTGQTSLWEPLVSKSESWLTGELAAGAVTVGGKPLEDWAAGLIRT